MSVTTRKKRPKKIRPFSYLFSRPKTAFFRNVDEPKLYQKSRPCLPFVLENEPHFISLGGYRTFRRPRKGRRRRFHSSVRPRLISIHFLRSCRCQNDVTSTCQQSFYPAMIQTKLLWSKSHWESTRHDKHSVWKSLEKVSWKNAENLQFLAFLMNFCPLKM